MVFDASGRVRADEGRWLFFGNKHPMVAGGLVVGLVALLATSACTFIGSGWAEPRGVFLLIGAALCVALSWIVATRLQAGHARPVATWQHTDAGEARGTRRHRRYVPANRTTVLHLQDGRRVTARIAEISMAAVTVEATLSDIDYASVLRIGSREVGPIRRTAGGAIFAFSAILDPQPFDRSFVL